MSSDSRTHGNGVQMNPLTVPADRLDRLRTICLALPEASEKVAWGDPTWRVRDKIFAMQKGNYQGGRPSVWIKAPDGAQPLIVGADPGTFFVPPYVGHRGWIGCYLDGARLDWDLLQELIRDSYRLTAPKTIARTVAANHRVASGRVSKRAGSPRAGAGAKADGSQRVASGRVSKRAGSPRAGAGKKADASGDAATPRDTKRRGRERSRSQRAATGGGSKLDGSPRDTEGRQDERAASQRDARKSNRAAQGKASGRSKSR